MAVNNMNNGYSEKIEEDEVGLMEPEENFIKRWQLLRGLIL